MNPRRVAATLASSAVLAAGLVGLAPTSASAAYTVVVRHEGGKMQMCRATVDGAPAVRFRLDNRDARFAQEGGLVRERDGASRRFAVPAAAGRLSDTKTVVVKAGDGLDGFVASGQSGNGAAFRRDDLRAC
jgi:hypothetical protein